MQRFGAQLLSLVGVGFNTFLSKVSPPPNGNEESIELKVYEIDPKNQKNIVRSPEINLLRKVLSPHRGVKSQNISTF